MNSGISQIEIFIFFLTTMAESAAKRPKCVIGTHNGKFHCDEVLACRLLTTLHEYQHAEIVRSRSPEKLDECDIVVDVGGVYDPERHRYDHHQRSFNGTMNSINPKYPWTTKLSSAGLVYLHFGRRVIGQIIEEDEKSSVVDVIYKKVYENFIEEIDAVDNGITQCDEKPRYRLSTTISSRVGFLNPPWNVKNLDERKQFDLAMELVGAEFEERVHSYHKIWLPARDLVKASVEKRHEVDSSGEIIVLEQCGCPWKEHLYDLEDEMGIEGIIKFALFGDSNGAWRVQCVPEKSQSFSNRLSLKKEWCGHRDEELSRLSGIPGCVFVHANGFIGGNESREGALKMAQETLYAARKES
ncbi:MYG1 exonuclease-like isoform X1 [Corticium candelabrum]|uniref:MYG1 exonuclease-like isoform X1 n=1 Tax=Corticium candelabrum TaxID=121492 RepID=UPI002E2697CD|nr:MYG1 exonuclease-like isoform X1 [Corticium candelabrum]